MPFDCTPVIDPPKQFSAAVTSNDAEVPILRFTASTKSSSIPDWYMTRQSIDTSIAVLIRARALIGDERRWCKGTLARGWLDLPVAVQSRFARRFCAIGAIDRAGRELGFSTEGACRALECQTIRSIPSWNDARRRTHAEVVAAFDAAITTLDATSAS